MRVSFTCDIACLFFADKNKQRRAEREGKKEKFGGWTLVCFNCHVKNERQLKQEDEMESLFPS